MNHQEAFQFTASSLGMAITPSRIEVVKQQIISNKVSWEKVVWVASNEMVMPALHLQYRLHGMDHLLPLSLRDYFENVYQLNTKRNERILSQAIELNELLGKRGIHPIFLKGVACIADGVYYSIGERMIGDIDFLVSDDEFLKNGKNPPKCRICLQSPISKRRP